MLFTFFLRSYNLEVFTWQTFMRPFPVPWPTAASCRNRKQLQLSPEDRIAFHFPYRCCHFKRKQGIWVVKRHFFIIRLVAKQLGNIWLAKDLSLYPQIAKQQQAMLSCQRSCVPYGRPPVTVTRSVQSAWLVLLVSLSLKSLLHAVWGLWLQQ